ncbi:uncharacterized protein TNCV_1674651 [Trichonephila clavipes]|nr:uncharacterized protein TNCV_1674651 [Trichonephila clavipes]
MSSGCSLPKSNLGVQGGIQGDSHILMFFVNDPSIEQKGCAAFHSREEFISSESLTSFPEDTSIPYSGFEPGPTRLQVECHYHHTGCGGTQTHGGHWLTRVTEAAKLLQILRYPWCTTRRPACVLRYILGKYLVAAVAEWYRYRIVACLVTSSSPVPLKTCHVGQRCTLNLSRAETSSRWCGVVVRRGGASSDVVHVT